jgi:hypothetical protein
VRDLLAIAIKAMLTSNGLPENKSVCCLSKPQLMNLSGLHVPEGGTNLVTL